MTLPALPSLNGHSSGAVTPATSMTVPEALRPRLAEVGRAYEEARSAMQLYVKSLMVVLGLPPDSEWDIDTETGILTPHRTPDATLPE